MSVTLPRYSARGVRTLLPGQRVVVDPELRSSEGSVLIPTFVSAGEGGYIASLQEAGPEAGTFDLQNITTIPLAVRWYAEFVHSVQYNHAQETQAGLGPNGLDPSPRPPLIIGGGAALGNVEGIRHDLSFATPGVIPLASLNVGDLVDEVKVLITTPFDDLLSEIRVGDGVTVGRFWASLPTQLQTLTLWGEIQLQAITAPSVLTLTQTSGGTLGAGILLVRIVRA